MEITIEINKCKKCGYEWIGRIENPKACPECKSRTWNKDVKKKMFLKKIKI